MKCELDQVLAVVSRFAERTRGVPPETVAAETRLLQEGVLDSFSLVELSSELEAALGVQFSDGTLLPEDFETPLVLFTRLRQV